MPARVVAMIPNEIKVFDQQGAEQTAAWLAAEYGDVLIWRSTSASAFRVIELRERAGTASVVATVRGDFGEPAEGIAVARAWGSDIAAGKLSGDLKPLPAELAEWFSHGVSGHADANGAIGFAMGSGDHYDPKTTARGPGALWCERPADCVVGLGMIFDNRRHLEPVFEWMAGSQPPEPPPGPDFAALIAKLDVAIQEIAEVIGYLQELPSDGLGTGTA